MAARRPARVLVTRNFEDNLAGLEAFLERAGAGDAFDRFLGDLIDRVVPLLALDSARAERSGLGRPFPEQSYSSPELLFVLERVRRRLQGRELRQLVRGSFVVLYVEAARTLYLVAVKHSREREFRVGR